MYTHLNKINYYYMYIKISNPFMRHLLQFIKGTQGHPHNSTQRPLTYHNFLSPFVFILMIWLTTLLIVICFYFVYSCCFVSCFWFDDSRLLSLRLQFGWGTTYYWVGYLLKRHLDFVYLILLLLLLIIDVDIVKTTLRQVFGEWLEAWSINAPTI